jgi:murein DD-endopeptidase MepM/ murein hydrolase activator NlpD
MLELFKTLFTLKEKSVQVIVIDPEDTSNPKEIFFKKKYLERSFLLLFSSIAVFSIVFLTLFVMRLTFGGDATIRTELNAMVLRVNALSDSLQVRDQQLLQIKQLLRTPSSQANQETRITPKSNVNEINASSSDDRPSEIVFPEEWNKMGRMVGFRPGIRQNAKTNSRSLFPAQLPIKGTITRTYLPAVGHFGLDIALREGSSIRSFADGVVISAEWTLSYGYVVSVMHDDNVIVVYKHLNYSRIQSGDRILKGQEIGSIGNVGTLSTGSHLHVEVWSDGTHVDPMLYFILDSPTR